MTKWKPHILTCLLTPWCRVLLEKLTGLQWVKKFSAFHGTRRFITALTSVRHLSLSWASPTQSIYPHPTSWRSVLILTTHLRLGLPSGLLSSVIPSQLLVSNVFFFRGQKPLIVQSHLTVESSRSPTNTPHSVQLLWTRDQPYADYPTWQHTTQTTDRNSCRRRYSNPQIQTSVRPKTHALDSAATVTSTFFRKAIWMFMTLIAWIISFNYKTEFLRDLKMILLWSPKYCFTILAHFQEIDYRYLCWNFLPEFCRWIMNT